MAMETKHRTLLTIDGVVNILLGVLLLLFPLGIGEVLGVPQAQDDFYPTILGGVIFGIGIALFIERFGADRNIRGLGLGGAIAINLCGSLTLLIWLIFSPPAIPLRGSILLWVIGILVFGIGIVELAGKSWKYGGG
jgi:hypothetical protein